MFLSDNLCKGTGVYGWKDMYTVKLCITSIIHSRILLEINSTEFELKFDSLHKLFVMGGAR